MSALSHTTVFNNKEVLIEGWYWLFRSRDLKKGEVKPVSILGRELVVFRGEDDKVRCMEAYCPHMGAHLKDGHVEGSQLRCAFHHWKFDENGLCTDIPCSKFSTFVQKIKTFVVQDHYGLIWLWSGPSENVMPLAEIPELPGVEVDSYIGKPFLKDCHPSVMMINAIDAQHFNSVHPEVKKLAGKLIFDVKSPHPRNIQFENIGEFPTDWWLGRILSRFYKGALTYNLSYWYGSTGIVTLGPDFLHLYLMFALRPTLDGKSEGFMALLTRRRKGLFGKLASRLILHLTRIAGNYFAKGDTLIFKSIRFALRSPIKEDHAIISFIQHSECLPISKAWKNEPSNELETEEKEVHPLKSTGVVS